MDILIANILTGTGSAFALVAYYFISHGKEEAKAHLFYLISCIFIIIGSYMLNSWPVIYLNVIWAIMSLWGLKKKSPATERALPDLKRPGHAICGFLTLSGIALLLHHYDQEMAANITTIIYLLAYFLFCNKMFSREGYVFWCTAGYCLLLPHLLHTYQYAVLANETLGVIIGVAGIVKMRKTGLSTT